jgi:hypothetical protein
MAKSDYFGLTQVLEDLQEGGLSDEPGVNRTFEMSHDKLGRPAAGQRSLTSVWRSSND